MKNPGLLALLSLSLALAVSPALHADPAPASAEVAKTAKAAKAGFSAERLKRLDAAIEEEIRQQQLAGGVMYVARDGKPVVFKAYGQQDIENGVAMRPDAIFRIASMTKALSSVAAMMLYEEGRFLLKDPVAKFIPAFANTQVATANGGTEKLKRAITIRDLLRHTAGMSYGYGPAAAAYKQGGFFDWYQVDKDETLEQWVNRFAAVPLNAQPGEAWQYGFATDVLGRVVEIVSGMPLDRFIAERITGPLGMKDTSFFLPPEKAHRLANVYGLDQGKLLLQETAARSDFVNGPRKFLSGGAGLLSTAGDYGRFLQMLLNGGELDGKRLLSPKTVALMSTNHSGNLYRSADGDGFGLGFWVIQKLGDSGELGSEGSYGWGSAYFPQYVVDPKERLILFFMTQLRPAGSSNLNQRVKVLSYQALIK